MRKIKLTTEDIGRIANRIVESGGDKMKELKIFKKHFEENCSVPVDGTIHDKWYPHWVRLIFTKKLNCDDLLEIATYIEDTFSVPGKFAHLGPKLGIFEGELCLTVSVKQIKTSILNE